MPFFIASEIKIQKCHFARKIVNFMLISPSIFAAPTSAANQIKSPSTPSPQVPSVSPQTTASTSTSTLASTPTPTATTAPASTTAPVSTSAPATVSASSSSETTSSTLTVATTLSKKLPNLNSPPKPRLAPVQKPVGIDPVEIIREREFR